MGQLKREDDVLIEKYFHIHTPSADAQRLFLYPQLSAFAVCDHGYFRSRSSYPHYLLLLIIQGSIFLTVPNHNYILPSGSVLLIDMRHPHIYGTYGDTLPQLYWMHFNGTSMPHLYQYIISNSNTHIFPADSSFILQFSNLIKDLASNEKQLSEMAVSAEIYQLLSHLKISGHQHSASIQPAINYIRRNYSDTITLKTLSSLVHMSIPHFSARFKHEMGISPYAYVIDIRLTAANYMLISSSQSVEEISSGAGFKSTSSFIKAFAKKKKKTPGQLRRDVKMSLTELH